MGTLYLVATPIGNLEDITLRALRTLREVRLIAAEDTRQTRKLLSRYQIPTPVLSYHEHNKLTRLGEVLAALKAGDVALVTDAGTPGLSDPGFELVRAGLAAGFAVQPVPGPSAPIAALVASGLPTDSFVFLGYLPRRRAERRRMLESLAAERRTLLAFEAPHRMVGCLDDLTDALGQDRPVVLCREMTKLHEEFFRGTLGAAQAHLKRTRPRGEFTLVIGGAGGPGAQDDLARKWSQGRVRSAVRRLRARGQGLAQAARDVAAKSGWDRRAVYRLISEDE